MKATRKLIPAIALLLVSAVLLSTASFAWFTTNKKVETSMTVSVTTPQNLMISVDGGPWANSAKFNDDDAYTRLTPVSSEDGVNFVLSNNLQLEGALTHDDLSAIKNAGGELGSFSDVTSATVGNETYYIAVPFQLRSSQPINGTDSKIKCTVTVESSEGSSEAYAKALRIFILDSGNKNAVVVSSCGSESVNDCFPIVKDGDNGWKLSTDKFANKDGFSDNVTPVTFDAAEAKSYTIVVWLEGNDPDCATANIDSLPQCNISVDFEIETNG